MRRAVFAVLPVLFVLPGLAAADDEAELKEIVKWAKPVIGNQCEFPDFESGEQIAGSNQVYRFDYRYSYETEADTPHSYTLYKLHCMTGAYNFGYIYVTRNYFDDLAVISFAEPKLDIAYSDEDTMIELKNPPKIIGYGATNMLINGDFDPETKTITSYNKWRSIGDAWSSGTWAFSEGDFYLKEYSVDPIYNLNAENASEEQPDSDIYRIFP